ncbi:MAG: helicase-exonuclease AddAB subunit AddA [Clostridia bacterium]|nr:helicase-exonuclease AddAB subunit AddA [Clostridia bacterium]
MAFNFTDMQKAAIDTKGNVLVAAAAGSGKTAVLVERVIKMLCDSNLGVTADRLLIVTFTNAAAAEMRSRIEKRLYDEIQRDPDNTALIKQKYLLSNADICTIDSFCIKLVRENFEKCGIEPDFKVSDGTTQGDIYKSVMKSLIADYIESPTDDFVRLLELTGCEFDESRLTDLINRIYLHSQNMPNPKSFITGLLKPYECKFAAGNAWYDMAFTAAQKRFEDISLYIKKMTECAPYTAKNTEQHISYAQKLCGDIDVLCAATNTLDWDQFADAISGFKFDRAPAGDKTDPFTLGFKDSQDKIKKCIKELETVFFAHSDEVSKFIAQDYNAVKLLCDMTQRYTDMVFEAFSAENSYTFSQIEQLALNLLCDLSGDAVVIRDTANALCERYDEVLVDEFQDVNDLQNMLFYVLSNREKNLFVVGDVKQSIYGFRGSNPDNFLSKKNSYIPLNEACQDDAKKIILSDNFRSRKGVCNTVNFFFSNLMAGQAGSIIYNQEERLNAEGKFPESVAATSELLLLDKFEMDDNTDTLEAQKIAEYIKSVMGEGAVITDGDALRPARYGDFAILLDKARDNAAIIAQTLTEQGIPVSMGGESYLESIEIATVMSLLQTIDNPKCDVDLLSVMMSPLFGFTAEDMATIRINCKNGPLYSAVLAFSKSGDKKTSDFINTLTALRQDAAVLSVDRLISKLIHSTDILNQMSALAGGKARRANLFTLIKFAKSYNDLSQGGIYGFLRYMKSLPEKSFKSAASGSEDAVKIMTMHASKGLQFPVCIIADLSSQFNRDDSINPILFTQKGGIAFKYYDEKLGYDVNTLGHILMSNTAKSKTVAEKLRLLYVAMTRAVDRLCLVCSVKNLEEKLTKLSLKLSDSKPYISRPLLEGSLTMGDWILSCALLHSCGKKLCDYADIKVTPTKDDSDLSIKIFNSFDKQDDENKAQSDIDAPECDLQIAQKIKSNAEYVYPFEELRFLQAKASVSRLVHGAEDDRFAFSEKPAFMAGDKLLGAARGTAVHHIMQFINFEKEVNVPAELDRLVEWKFITKQEAVSADIKAIEHFFESDVYKRILASSNVYREKRFLTEIPAGRFDKKMQGIDGANIIVQGAVDLCFEEPDGIVVLDFKTDHQDDPQKLKDYYAEQLNIYATAVEKIFNKPVKEKIIYSMYLGKGISF